MGASDGTGAAAPREFGGTDRFEIRRRLGSGGMGVVYEAYDRERQIKVALKTLSQRDPDALLWFKREFRALAGVSHRNLVSLYELIAEGDEWFFTMELLEGVDVVSWVRRQPTAAPLEPQSETSAIRVTRPALHPGGDRPEEEEEEERRGGTPDYARLRAVLRQLAEGLNTLHRSGHLHRDIKPSNVLVDAEGRVVILDFGVITELAAATRGVAGTPAYMAPEQAGGDNADPASDWYGVGAILYEAVTGLLPFRGSRSAIIEAKKHWDPLRPQLERPDLPADLDRLCMRLLDRDPERRADGREILRALSKRRRRTSSHSDADIVLHGRERELDELRGAFERTAVGQPSVVHVTGSSGMGKTALVHHFLADLEEGDAVVLAGRCYENESVPFKAIDAVVDALADHLAELPPAEQRQLLPKRIAELARMFPVLRRVEEIAARCNDGAPDQDRAESRRLARSALRQVIGALARRRPLVLFIDDLHWGDLESAPLLDALTRPPLAPPILLITTYRPADAERSALVRALLRRHRRLSKELSPRFIDLPALSPDASMELAVAVLDAWGGDVTAARRVAAESAGNPYLIGEVARFAASRRGSALTAPTLESMLEQRIRGLDGTEVRLLEILSIASRPLPQRTARAAAAVEPADWPPLIHRLRAARLVRVSGLGDDDTIEPYHDRIRETVAAGLGAARGHHRALATSLDAHHAGEPHELAHHFFAAGDRERASWFATRAARRASELLAFDRAAALWRLAIEAATPDGQDLCRQLTALGRTLVWAGSGGEAARVFTLAARHADGLQSVELRRRAAEQYLRAGYISDGLAMLEEVLGEVALPLPTTARAAVPRLLWSKLRLGLRGLRFRRRTADEIPPRELVRIDVCLSACIGLALIDVARAASFASLALRLALATGEPTRVARALAIESGFSAGSGRPKRTRALLDAAHELAKECGDTELIEFVKVAGLLGRFEDGDFARFQDAAEISEQRLRRLCRGVAWELRTLQTLETSALFYLGRIERLAEVAPEWLASAEERGDLYAQTNFLGLSLPIVKLAAGDVEGARRDIERAEAIWRYPRFTLQRLYITYIQIVVDLYQEEDESAWRRAEACSVEVERSLLMYDRAVGNFWAYLRSSAALSWSAASEADRARCWRRARRDAARLWRDPAPCYRGMGAALRAALAYQAGDEVRGRAWLERAVASFDRAEVRILAGCARVALGRREGDSDLLEAGRTSVRDCGGADPDRIARALVGGI